MAEPPDPAPRAPSLAQVAGSVLAAFFGVQSARNRRRDFTRGNPLVFIVMGLLMTLALIGAVFLAVTLVLARSGVALR